MALWDTHKLNPNFQPPIRTLAITAPPITVTTTLTISGPDNSIATLQRHTTLPVTDALPTLSLAVANATRGADLAVRLTLENPGAADLELITASDNQPSPEVRVELLDADGNRLASAPLQQASGDAVITLANGTSIARIAPGERYTSAVTALPLPLPLDAPDRLSLRLVIDHLHHGLGDTHPITLPGLTTRQPLTLTDAA